MRFMITAAALLLACPPLPAQTIARASAPALGKPLAFDYASAPGSSYVMFTALPPRIALPIPGIGGSLALNPLGLQALYTRAVPAGGLDTASLPVPANSALLGASLAFQALDIQPSLALAFSNAMELAFCNGIGIVLLAQGSDETTTGGDLDLVRVTNARAGDPASLMLGKGAVQPVSHYGPLGFVPLANPGGVVTCQADMHVDTGRAVARDSRDYTVQHIQTPGGHDLYVMRDNARMNELYLVSVNRAMGIARELTGSRMVDSNPMPPAASIFRNIFAFTPDGAIGAAVVHDSQNVQPGNQGPPDRVLLFYTDYTKTWPGGKNAVDISPLPPAVMHTVYNGPTRINNGVLFVEGEEPSGTTGAAALWAAAIDGTSRLARIAVPNTGTGKPFFWSRNRWRASADGTAAIFLSGGDPANSGNELDLMALTDIGPAKNPVVRNVTAFPVPTVIQTFGHSGLGSTPDRDFLRAALSPDGKHAAIVLGGNTTAAPGAVAIVPTDGSKAGAIQPFTAAAFDPQVTTFADLWWVSPTRLLFMAGIVTPNTNPQNLDYYAYDLGSGQVTNITKTCTGSKSVPLTAGGNTGNIRSCGSWLSDNGKFFYFLRYYWNSSTVGRLTNVVGIDCASLAVFDVTGKEFSAGATPDLRADSYTYVVSWMFRRSPVGGDVFFASARSLLANTTDVADDELWRFDAEAGTPALQLTRNNGRGANLEAALKINDNLVLAPSGTALAYAQGRGTLIASGTEEVFLLPAAGGSPRRLSSPAAAPVAIARGSLLFTPAPVDGLLWVEGADRRGNPSRSTQVLWAPLSGGVPLRLSAPPDPSAPRFLYSLAASPLNP